MKKILYWLEMCLAPCLSAALLFLNPTLLSPILFAAGALTATFAEYAVHAWLLHGLRVRQHLDHHRRPQDKIYSVYWLLWAAMLPSVFVSPALSAGIVAGYWYYLVVHHCAHHDRRWLTSRLLAHHDGHHRFSSKNFGVSTVFWDSLFRTRLRG